MKVLIPTPLRSYTQEKEVEAQGSTIAELLSDLERRYPGIRFRMIDEQDRMRPHIRFFVNGPVSSTFPSAVTLITPRGPNLFRNSGSFGYFGSSGSSSALR